GEFDPDRSRLRGGRHAARDLRRHGHRRLPPAVGRHERLGAVRRGPPARRRQPPGIQRRDAPAPRGDVRPRHLGDLDEVRAMSARIRVLVALAVVSAAACGGSTPASPDALDLTGTWTGTWTYVTSGVTISDGLHVTITAGSTNANGAWTADSGASG